MRLLVSALLAAIIVTTSATAATAGGVDVDNGVLYSDCRQHTYSYSADLPDFYASWSMDAAIYGPDGLEIGSDFHYDQAPTGVASFQVCGSEDPGTWTMEATGTWYDQDYNEHPLYFSGDAFTMRATRSKTAIAVSGSKRLTFKGAVRDERPSGYFPSDFVTVALQTKRAGRWVTVATSSTDDKGRVRMTTKNKPGKQAFRLVTRPASYNYFAGSVSRVVKR